MVVTLCMLSVFPLAKLTSLIIVINFIFKDDFQKNLSEICLTLNAKCHTHIKKIVEQDARSPHLIEAFEIEKFIDSIDSDLWKAVCLLTQPLSLRAVKKESSHARKVRRLLCICTLLFTMNSQCLSHFTLS